MISIIYSTCRNRPRIELFLDSLYYDIIREKVDISLFQIVIVDFYLQYDESRKELFNKINNNRFDIVHVSSKPSPWQGPHRITSKNMFCASIPRNTGICYAKYDYIMFMDDNGYMKPGSLKYILDYANKNLTIAFGYQYVGSIEYTENGLKYEELENNGKIDVRISQGDKFRKLHGSQMYGHCAMPLKNVLFVNGYDETCNGLGYEDYQFGIRLMNANVDIFFSSYVLFYETKNIEPSEHFLRVDFLLEDSHYENLMKKYNITNRWHRPGSKHLSYFMLDMLTGGYYFSYGNDYNLKELRDVIQKGGSFSLPKVENNKTFYGVYLKDIVELWDTHSNTKPISVKFA